MPDPVHTILQKVKLSLRITVDDYDVNVNGLIDAAKLDLGIAGVELPTVLDAICEQAIITYCNLHFSALTDGEYSRLKASYDEQKAQLSTATGYTVWGDAS